MIGGFVFHCMYGAWCSTVFYISQLYNEILAVSVHCYLTELCNRGLSISLYAATSHVMVFCSGVYLRELYDGKRGEGDDGVLLFCHAVFPHADIQKCEGKVGGNLMFSCSVTLPYLIEKSYGGLSV